MTNDKTLTHLALCLALAFAGTAEAQTTDAPSDTSSTEETASGEAPSETTPADAPADGATAEEEAAPTSTTSTTATDGATESTDGSATALSAPAATDEEAEGEGDEDEGPRTEAEAEEAQAETEPLAWRNSFFSVSPGVTFNSFDRGAQLSYNPYAYLSFALTPRWYLTSSLFLVANILAYYEMTDSDSDTYNHEFAMSDTTLEARYTLPVDRFVFIPSVRLTFPTSKLSQAAQRYFNTGVGLTTVLQIPEFLSSNIALGVSYRRWWAGSNVALSQNPFPASTAIPGPRTGVGAGADGEVGSFSDSMGGAATASDRILTSLTLNVTPVSGLTVTLQGVWVWDHAFDNGGAYLGCETVSTVPCGSVYEVPMSEQNYRWRWFTAYTLQVAYDLAAWFNLSVGITNATSLSPFFNDNGSVRSPFNPDTQLFLSATITLDGLYEEITRGADDDGLTPEERQRRRQGLATLEGDFLDEEESEETGGASSSRATTF